MVLKQISFFFLSVLSLLAIAQTIFLLESPSSQLRVTIKVEDSIYFSLQQGGQQVVGQSAIALITRNAKLGIGSRIKSEKRLSVRDTIINPVPFKWKQVLSTCPCERSSNGV
jgi:hypothetical protein